MKDQTRTVIRLLTEYDSTPDLLLIQSALGHEIMRRTKLRGIAAISDWWTCPRCRRTSYGPETHGYRAMGDGTIRAQSWCRGCRSKR